MLWLFVTALVAVVASVAAGVRFVASRFAIEQPIAFRHQLHIDEVGMVCLDCHQHARRGARATIPNIDVCGDCHDEVVGDSADEVLLARHVTDGVPIPWQKVYTVPGHVLFSHRRHVAIAEIPCETCHGLMAERTLPVTSAEVSTKMADCIRCHEESDAPIDCILCHR